jgi:hypothetical protein
MKKPLQFLLISGLAMQAAYAQPAWRASRAPIGDASAHDYVGTLDPSLTHTSGEELSVTAVTGAPDGVHVYRIDEQPNTTAGITGLGGNDKYFGVFVAGGTSPTYTVTYDYAGNPYTADEADFELFDRSDNSVTPWVNSGLTPDQVNDHLVLTGEADRGEYIIGSSGFPLPIELLRFDANWTSTKQESATITWNTAIEINTSHFIVQRSIDNQNWYEVASIAAGGNTSTQQSYQTIDLDPYHNGVSYYRLKQYDLDGTFNYTQVESLYPSNTIDIITLYPNPVVDEFTYQIYSSKETEVSVSMVNSLGQVVYRKEHRLVPKGISNHYINVSRLSAGDYILHVRTTSGLQKTSKKFVVESQKK